MKTSFGRKTAVALAFAACLAAGSVYAADAKPQTPQQQKFGACAKDAHEKGLKGADYKTYMSTCAKSGPTVTAAPTATAPTVAPTATVAPVAPAAADAKVTQQEKMKTCNADAKTKALAGDDRKKFMSTCLSGSAAAH
jgi:psiF repeat